MNLYINGVLESIIKKLNIKDGKKISQLKNIIEEKETKGLLNDNISDNKKILIEKLLGADDDIRKFETEFIEPGTQTIKDQFSLFKNNIGELQVLVLIKLLEKSKNCDEVINSFLNVINNKVSSVNDILNEQYDSKEDNEEVVFLEGGTKKTINQKGGANFYIEKYIFTDKDEEIINKVYKEKYLKYKNKYLKYKNI
jgi:hypothetical protein